MKKRYKFLILFVVLIGVFVSFYYYQLNKYMKLNDTDRAIILKSFGKDSDGKGYSDDGHRVMMEDLAQLKGKIPDEKLKEFEFFYKATMISRRTSILSKNSEEFIKNEIVSIKTKRCWADIYIYELPEDFKKEKGSFFFQNTFGEAEEFVEYSDILFDKYTIHLSNLDVNNIINTFPEDGECHSLYLKSKNSNE